MNILGMKSLKCPVCGSEMPCKFAHMAESMYKSYKVMYRCENDPTHILWVEYSKDEVKEQVTE